MGRRIKGKKIRLSDIIVSIICVLGILIGVIWSHYNYNQTITSTDNKKVGTITQKENSVQRRQGRRLQWERMANGSEVYQGDLIWTEVNSKVEITTVITMENGGPIRLDENSMFRVWVLNGIWKIEGEGIYSIDGDPGEEVPIFENGIKRKVEAGTTQYVSVEPTEPAGGRPLSLTEDEPEPLPASQLRLEFPEERAELPGLTALRQPTIFGWSTAEELGSSRIIISRNSDPLRAPEAENWNFIPDRQQEAGLWHWMAAVERLEQGRWYWTVEAWTRDGRRFINAEPRQLQVLTIEDLPAAEKLQPSRGHNIGDREARELRMQQGGLLLSWQAVEGANGYDVTVFRETSNGKEQIDCTYPPINQPRWLLRYNLWDRGTFVWQVEAVNRSPDGRIDQHGKKAESSFYMDISRLPQIRNVRVDDDE